MLQAAEREFIEKHQPVDPELVGRVINLPVADLPSFVEAADAFCQHGNVERVRSALLDALSAEGVSAERNRAAVDAYLLVFSTRMVEAFPQLREPVQTHTILRLHEEAQEQTALSRELVRLLKDILAAIERHPPAPVVERKVFVSYSRSDGRSTRTPYGRRVKKRGFRSGRMWSAWRRGRSGGTRLRMPSTTWTSSCWS